MSMIRVENVTKRFGPILAVDKVSFQVSRGEVVGFLGPNGAGKSTTMRILAGFFPPTSGRASVGDHDVVSHAYQVKEIVGYFPERVSVYPDLPVHTFLRFVAEAKGVPRSERKRAVGTVTEACGLQEVRTRIIGHLSKGYRQRVGIAQALMHRPQVLILDEPTIGLDPAQVVEIRKLIRTLGSERTVILSTHILSEVSSVCDRVIIINRGRILASESLETLRTQLHRNRQVRVAVTGAHARVPEALNRLPGVVQVRPDQDGELAHPAGNGSTGWIVEHGGEDVRTEISQAVLEQGCGLLELRSLEPTLEDMYLQLIRQAQEEYQAGHTGRGER